MTNRTTEAGKRSEMTKDGTPALKRQGYTGPRPDVLALLPEHFASVLDVGCGAGALGASIKHRWKNCRVVGMENDPRLFEMAEKQLDKALKVDLNESDPFHGLGPEERFDVIVFADVLEHLVVPHRLLASARSHLAEGGCIIISLPNVRHYSTFVSLGFLGSWPQRDRGIHDRTHLHFYAKKNMLELFSACGLIPVKEKRNLRLVERWSWTNPLGKALDFWPFRGFLTFQYLYRVVPGEGDSS